MQYLYHERVALFWPIFVYNCRAVGRSENLKEHAECGGHNVPPLAEIWLTDLQKNGGGLVPTNPSGYDSTV